MQESGEDRMERLVRRGGGDKHERDEYNVERRAGDDWRAKGSEGS